MADVGFGTAPSGPSIRPIRPVFGPAARRPASPTTTSSSGFDKTQPYRGKSTRTRPSAEQQAVVDSRAQLCVVNAFAGTGKTTTAVSVAEAHPSERILYLCLNKANQVEAQGRFPSNVTAMTTHAVARAQMSHSLGDGNRICNEWRPITLRQELMIPSNRLAALTQVILNEFFNSEDLDINSTHTALVADQWHATEREVSSCIDFAVAALAQMRDPGAKVSIPNNAYLKWFALRAPHLPFDRIIFDEAQDANPVTAQIIREQAQKNSTKVLCIGDRHQAIYGFRGSIDAMTVFGDMPGAELLHLTTTWRFGPETAQLANTLLRELKGERTQIVGAGTAGEWTPANFTLLARTNAQLLNVAALRSGRGIHWLGGLEGYRIGSVEDAYQLFRGNSGQVQSRFFQNFASWRDFEDYATSARDAEAKIIQALINQYQHDTPSLINDIRANAVCDPRDAELILTTGHKSKGLDWNCVAIGEDFELLAEVEQFFLEHPGKQLPLAMEQEINLLYVVMTRAKQCLRLNGETQSWLANLHIHQRDRQNAVRIKDLAIRKAKGLL